MNHRVCLLYVLFVFALFGFVAQAQPCPGTPSAKFGRKWFTNAPRDEIRGFLTGYDDCLPNPAQRKLPGWYFPIDTMVERISDFYSSHKNTNLDVAAVALKVAAEGQKPVSKPGGEVYTNRHGYLDGLWWRGAGEQVGYVEGYLVCLGRPVTKPGAERLAGAVSAWYRKHPSKDDRAIANVLEDILKDEKRSHQREN